MIKKKRILFISHYSDLYGANRSLLTIIEHFNSNDKIVRVLLPTTGTMSEYLEKKGIGYDIVRSYGSFLYIRPKLKHIIVPILGMFNVLVFPYIVFKVKKFKPDLIYSNTSAENLGIFISKFLKVKHICHIREMMSLSHKSYFIMGKSLKRKFVEWSDGVIFVSRVVASYIKGENDFNTLNTIIYNGLETPKGDLHNIGIPDDLKFGIVGLIDPAKGQQLAVNYFSKILKAHPRATLQIYGTGSGKYHDNLLIQIEQLGLRDKVVFHGFVNNIEKIYSFDILLMFSESEGFGRVTVEAMMRGIPVIGYDGGGTSELIDHKETGYLFKDFQGFSDSIEALISTEEFFNIIRKNAFKSSVDKFDDQKYCASVESFVTNVLEK